MRSSMHSDAIPLKGDLDCIRLAVTDMCGQSEMT
jgi:hypothetical protein